MIGRQTVALALAIWALSACGLANDDEVRFVGDEEATDIYNSCADEFGAEQSEVTVADGNGPVVLGNAPLPICVDRVATQYPPLTDEERKLGQRLQLCLRPTGFDFPIGTFTVGPAADGLQISTGSLAVPDSLDGRLTDAITRCRETMEEELGI